MPIGDSASFREAIMVGSMSLRSLIDGTTTGGMGVFELGVPPHSNVSPPHSHTANKECVSVLEGILRYAVEDDRPGPATAEVNGRPAADRAGGAG